MKRVVVRNIPDEIYTNLERQAYLNERSTEGHLRYIMAQSVNQEACLTGAERYQKEVSTRLNLLLPLVKEVQGHDNLTPVVLAEQIGQTDPLAVLNWFSGDDVPNFNQMESIAQYTGCESRWLKFGEGKPFKQNSGVRINWKGDGYKDALELLTPDQQGNPIYMIKIFRMEKSGSIMILRQFKDVLKAELSITNLYLSNGIGMGGFSDLCDFFCTLQHLYFFYIRNDFFVKSYDLNENYFKEIFIEGNCHPINVVSKCHAYENIWWEDIWHEEMLEKKKQKNDNYFWKEDHELINSILKELKIKKRLKTNKERKIIMDPIYFEATDEQKPYIINSFQKNRDKRE